jgi:A/G-specific adenine glycosylase
VGAARQARAAGAGVRYAPAVQPSRAAAVRRRLLAWWDAGRRDLPWRARAGEQPDPYRVWISEVMLQQTRVDAVIPYYARFLARFPTLETLAAAPPDEVLRLWSGLGYYARARNLHRAARETLARHGGLPADPAALRALPGFGPYTTGAVASLAFGARAAAVDGNVTRVLSRVFLVDAPPASRAARTRVAALADGLVPADRPGDFNQALMDLGATVCTKPVPACAACPLAGACEARAAGREREVPPARVRAAPRELEVACAVVRRRGALLVARRDGEGLLGGLWELPCAEVAPGADAATALRAALAARGLDVAPGAELADVVRTLTHRRLTLRAVRCGLRGAPPAGHRFARPAELAALGVSTAMRSIIEAADAAEAAEAARDADG